MYLYLSDGQVNSTARSFDARMVQTDEPVGGVLDVVAKRVHRYASGPVQRVCPNLDIHESSPIPQARSMPTSPQPSSKLSIQSSSEHNRKNESLYMPSFDSSFEILLHL